MRQYSQIQIFVAHKACNSMHIVHRLSFSLRVVEAIIVQCKKMLSNWTRSTNHVRSLPFKLKCSIKISWNFSWRLCTVAICNKLVIFASLKCKMCAFSFSLSLSLSFPLYIYLLKMACTILKECKRYQQFSVQIVRVIWKRSNNSGNCNCNDQNIIGFIYIHFEMMWHIAKDIAETDAYSMKTFIIHMKMGARVCIDVMEQLQRTI